MAQLSKSDYMLFLKHPAWLWLKEYEPHKLPSVDPSQQQTFDDGYEFEEYAEQIFPEAVKISLGNADEYRTMASRTSEAWKSGANCVSQGMYLAGETVCKTDILEVDKSGYTLTEIKSSTKAKPEHHWDLAFQKVILEKAGYPIISCRVAHVNSSYLRNGQIVSSEFIKFTEVTDEVEAKVEKTKINTAKALEVLHSKIMPEVAPELCGLGSFSEWLEIRKSLEPRLAPDSIYHLPYFSMTQAKKLRNLEISSISEITGAFQLSGATSKYWEAKLHGRLRVDQAALRNFLGKIEYPIYFLDYETTNGVVPPWDNTHPYQQVPFQYSLHVKRDASSPVEHLEYLHQARNHPTIELLESLSAHIEEPGSILVWYAPFETSRNTEMAKYAPTHADFLYNLNDRIIDLRDPFKHEVIVDPEFNGSTSIKKILPALVADSSYNDLDIQEGGSAARLWKEATINQTPDLDIQKTYSDLRAYCERDTLAMVLIHEKLEELVKS
jgi:hypothetical protein